MFVTLSKRLLEKLRNKKYRSAYVAEHTRTGIAYQIRAMREQRGGMSQSELGRLMNKPQSVISRLEDPDYGKVTLQTLFEVANAFDVALSVQFVGFHQFVNRTRNVAETDLQVSSFNEGDFITEQHVHVAEQSPATTKWYSASTSPGPGTTYLSSNLGDTYSLYDSSVPPLMAEPKVIPAMQ